MQPYPGIKLFVQNTLGCTCPDEVFEKIEYGKIPNKDRQSRINIGDRLLIYIVHIDSETDIAVTVKAALASGIAERNSKGFNRFRLVLVSSRDNKIRKSAEKAFHDCKFRDEKTHVHFVAENDISGFIMASGNQV